MNCSKPRSTAVPEGVALVASEGEVVLWNQAAQAITGYAAMEVLSRPIPEGLERSFRGGVSKESGRRERAPATALVRARHKLGHEVPVIARIPDLARRAGGTDRRRGAVSSGARAWTRCRTEKAASDAARMRPGKSSRSGCKRSSTTSSAAARRSAFCGLEWIRRRSCARRTARAPATRCSKRCGTRWCMGCARRRR